MNILYKTIIFAIIMLIIDIPWITFVMSKLYKNVFDIKLNAFSALIAYICMIITYPFIISKFDKLETQLKLAIVLGLVTFGTYGFTLAAIYNKYPLSLAIYETMWGMILYSVTTFITHKIIIRMKR